MIDQENPELDQNIQKYGCYFLSIAWLCAKAGKEIPISPEEWNKTRLELLGNGLKDIAQDMTVENAEAVFKYFGVNVRQVLNKSGGVAIGPSVEIPGALEVVCYAWTEKGYRHFMAGDGSGNIAYDPIHRGSNTAKHGHLESKRLFIVEV